ncbi:MAG: VanW family protein [Miltoncostaeaceae bacterium]
MRRRWPLGPYVTAGLAGLLVVLVAVAAIVGLRVAEDEPGVIPEGVSIGPVDVGGLDVDEAERAVRARTDELRPGGDVLLVASGAPAFGLRVPTDRLGLTPRIRRAVEEAAEQRPSLGERLRAEVGAPRRRTVQVDYRLDEVELTRTVRRVAGRIDRKPVDARAALRDVRFAVVPSREGIRVQRAELRARLRHLPERIDVATVAVPPRVTDDRAQVAVDRANLITRAPVNVTAARRRARVDRPTLREAVRFERRGRALAVSLDESVVGRAIRPALGPLDVKPTSARFVVRGKRVRVAPSTDGRGVDVATTTRRIAARPAAATVRARVAPVKPALTTDQAHRLRVRELVSEFTTNYACCPPRVTNIKLGAQAIDGTLIPPGGTFSLNEVMGERTLERGFVAAPQINAGRLEDAVGGGVSQIATTVFNAAWFAGVELVTHTPHQFYISRYPVGREATVSFGGPELIWRNDWPAAVLVKAVADDSGITVRLYSSKLGRRVESATGPNPAGGAFTVSYARKVFRGDELRHDDSYRWTYQVPRDT